MTLCNCGRVILSGHECRNCKTERVAQEQDERNQQYRESRRHVTVDKQTAKRYEESLFCDAT